MIFSFNMLNSVTAFSWLIESLDKFVVSYLTSRLLEFRQLLLFKCYRYVRNFEFCRYFTRLNCKTLQTRCDSSMLLFPIKWLLKWRIFLIFSQREHNLPLPALRIGWDKKTLTFWKDIIFKLNSLIQNFTRWTMNNDFVYSLLIKRDEKMIYISHKL